MCARVCVCVHLCFFMFSLVLTQPSFPCIPIILFLNRLSHRLFSFSFSFPLLFFSSLLFFNTYRYLDRNYTVAQGRRVSKEKALPQCNMREIVTVLESKKCALTCGFEPFKTHPKNPAGHKDGRIRVKSVSISATRDIPT